MITCILNRIRRLTSEDWPLIEERVLALENIFHENLRETGETLKELFSSRDSLVIGAFRKNRLIGYMAGTPLNNRAELPGAGDDPELGSGNSIYIDSFVVDKEFQGKGVGRNIEKMFLKQAGKMGYRFASSHIREEAAASKLPYVLSRHPEWFGTGKTYLYYSQPVRRLLNIQLDKLRRFL